MAMTLRDMMRKRLETIEESASVQEAAKKMKDKDISSLILVTKVCVNDTITSAITNKEIMSVPLITIDSTSPPAIAADMMLRYNVRHLLVIDDKNNSGKSDPKHFIGIITPLDFARYEEFPNDEVGKDEIERMLEYYI
jgi:CBS domain-containing protein